MAVTLNGSRADYVGLSSDTKPENVPVNTLFLELDTGDFDTTVLEINFAENCKATTRQVRPLPEGGGFFENVWREYRETKNIY